MPLLKRTSEQEQYSVASALAAPLQDNRTQKPVKKNPAADSPVRLQRQKNPQKIAAFRVPADLLEGET
ncbi:hypothetical protein [Bradyrhizobium sp. LB13.1]